MKWIRERRLQRVEDEGYNVGWIGMEKESNPYSPGSIEHRSWEIGYQDAIDDISSMDTSTYYPFNEYGDEVL